MISPFFLSDSLYVLCPGHNEYNFFFFKHRLDDFYLFIYLLKIYLFIFGCVGSLLLCAGFLWLRPAGGYSLRCGVQASHCGGFSCCGAWALGAQASVVVALGLSSCGLWALERRLSSCGARA